MSNTGKQQFTANQSIYPLSDKDRSVPDHIDLWRSVFTRLYIMHICNLELECIIVLVTAQKQNTRKCFENEPYWYI